MDNNVWKPQIAKIITKIAMKQANKTIGKSWPYGIYEPQVPKALQFKEQVKKDESNEQ